MLLLELAGYGLVLLLNYQTSREGLAGAREQQIAATFLGYVEKIDALTGAMERNAIDFALAGETYHGLRGELSVAQILPQIERHLVRNFALFPDALGGGLWYEPFAFDPEQKYFGPYAFRVSEDISFTWDLSTAEYDYPNQDWYRVALPPDAPRDRAPARTVVWTEPYWDEAGSKALMMTVDALMLDRERRPIGMATVDWSTEAMRAFVATIEVTPGSFAFLIDRRSGRFVSYVADPALVMQPASSLAWGSAVLEAARVDVLRHLTDVSWRERAHRVYFVESDVGLVLGMLIPEDEILLELMPALRESLYYGMLVSAFFIVAMALVLTLLFRPFQQVLGQISLSLRREEGKLALTPLSYPGQNEFTPIVDALNEVYERVSEFTTSLAAANDELAATHREVNDLNISLERKVVERTEELAQKNNALLHSLEDLRRAQRQLFEAEKHAALSQLVAGVAHEVNTPVGIALTAASHLRDEFTRIANPGRPEGPTYSDLAQFLDSAREASSITVNNLMRAANMVRSFKQISVDQSSEARRVFHLEPYIDDILLSLRPRLKHSCHEIVVDCPSELEIDSYPGALSQVLTNLVLNALLHAFPSGATGRITIHARREGTRLELSVSDNGHGIAPEHRPHIFEPFFTTRRGEGGSGLGLHIVYNLVTQTLGGEVRCESALDIGTTFVLDLPLVAGRDQGPETTTAGARAPAAV